ncbi:MAG TPA: metalloregulator ArsR/SmtB family transcription factor [Chitinophagaceae bacterium]|jgi:DNA-binding transcriptional ArsR family regulator|nr:metalloregulator ArsR/SmtB family transcription factor [Chitinophagaceae bacterium]
MRRDAFQAIADPTRRAIIHLLAGQRMNLHSVAEHFRCSRPAVSRHMKILQECGLVVVEREGREHYCTAQLERLQEVARWVGQYDRFWTGKLEALKEFLESGKEETNQ